MKHVLKTVILYKINFKIKRRHRREKFLELKYLGKILTTIICFIKLLNEKLQRRKHYNETPIKTCTKLYYSQKLDFRGIFIVNVQTSYVSNTFFLKIRIPTLDKMSLKQRKGKEIQRKVNKGKGLKLTGFFSMSISIYIYVEISKVQTCLMLSKSSLTTGKCSKNSQIRELTNYAQEVLMIEYLHLILPMISSQLLWAFNQILISAQVKFCPKITPRPAFKIHSFN